MSQVVGNIAVTPEALGGAGALVGTAALVSSPLGGSYLKAASFDGVDNAGQTACICFGSGNWKGSNEDR